MYEITVIKFFSAAHMLTDVGGKCEELHGHNFKVELTVSAQEVDKSGILIDFRHLKNMLSEVLENLDHKFLNNQFCFMGKKNPSSENIAEFISDEIRLKIKTDMVKVTRVKVWESEDAAVTYIPC